jgi:hypothetical protein
MPSSLRCAPRFRRGSYRAFGVRRRPESVSVRSTTRRRCRRPRLHSMPGWREPLEQASAQLRIHGIKAIVCLAASDEVRAKFPFYAAALDATTVPARWSRSQFLTSAFLTIARRSSLLRQRSRRSSRPAAEFSSIVSWDRPNRNSRDVCSSRSKRRSRRSRPCQ